LLKRPESFAELPLATRLVGVRADKLKSIS